MTTIEEKLSLIEAKIQKIVEGGAGLFFPSRQLAVVAARRFTEAIRDNMKVLPDGSLAAPDRLVLLVSPSEFDLFSDEKWLRELERSLRSVGQQQQVRFPSDNFLRVEARSQLSSNDLLIQSESTSFFVSETSGMAAEDEEGSAAMPGAFLIVDGTRIFPVEQVVTNLGRRPDNHLVIDDGRVSRIHAQLRFINGEFVIFDLDSRGGTFVNGKRVSQSNLQDGDVISLSGVPIVFGLEAATMGETHDFRLLE